MIHEISAVRRSIGFVCLVVAFSLILQPVALAGSVNRYRVHLNNGGIRMLQYCALSDAGINGRDRDGRSVTIANSDVHSLYRYDGNNAGRYALAGGTVGMAIAVLSYMSATKEANDDPFKEVDDSKAIPLMFAMTAGGAIFGALVGHNDERWTRIPLGAQFGLSAAGKELRFSLALSF